MSLPVVYPQDKNYATLEKIRRKVRFLTSSPSTFQLSDDSIDEYVNQFVLYDFSEHIRHINLHEKFTFYTQPYVDKYSNLLTPDPTSVTDNPLFNFKNRYITFNPPAFCAGQQMLWTQSEQEFYNMYPQISALQRAATASAVTGAGPYTGILNGQTSTTNGITAMIVKNSVLFETKDANSIGISLIDYPTPSSNVRAPLAPIGNTEDLSLEPYGYINYITGAFSATFTSAPLAGNAINSQVVYLQPSMPQAILFYGGYFRVRPVPDQVYPITMEAFVRPTELLETDALPDLAGWWEYIAYGASKKVFEDRRDFEGVQGILPEFTKQQDLIQRKTNRQYQDMQSNTIYKSSLNGAGFAGNPFFNGGNWTN